MNRLWSLLGNLVLVKWLRPGSQSDHRGVTSSRNTPLSSLEELAPTSRSPGSYSSLLRDLDSLEESLDLRRVLLELLRWCNRNQGALSHLRRQLGLPDGRSQQPAESFERSPDSLSETPYSQQQGPSQSALPRAGQSLVAWSKQQGGQQ